MGINVSKPKSQNKCATVEPEIDSALTQSKTTEFDSVFKVFKEDLLTICLGLIPTSSLELKKYISITTENYKEMLKNKLESLKYSQTHNNRIIGLFALKSKAIEGYFFYLNDLNSLRVVHDTKVEVFNEFFCGTRNISELTTTYYKKAKGSFLLQGLQEMLSLVSEDQVSGFEMIGIQYEENMHKLNQIYSELLISKAIDSDIYAATVGKLK